MSRANRDNGHGFSNTAFLVEALMLLVMVAGVLAVLMSLFAQAYNIGKQSRDEAGAILLASNVAEQFTAAPEAGITLAQDEAHVACCVVVPQQQEGGVLYQAHIAVYDSDEAANAVYGAYGASDVAADAASAKQGMLAPEEYAASLKSLPAVYQLDTARYVSGAIA